MRNLIFTLAFLISFSVSYAIGYAEEEPFIKWIDFKKVAITKVGMAWSAENFGINHIETVEFARPTAPGWNRLSLNAGYAGDSDSVDHKLVGTISINLFEMKKYFNFPIIDLLKIEPFGWFGAGKLNFKNMGESETDAGAGCYFIGKTITF